jgi:hypothetical protein
MKHGETASVGLSKETKLRLQKLYFKEITKNTISNYDDLINYLIDIKEKGGKK